MIFLLLALFYLGIIAFYLYCSWRLYEKAGRAGWEGIIPFYNLYVMLKITGKPAWWFILFLIPIVNYVFLIWTTNMLSKSFGKEEGFTVGLVLLGFIFFPILALGDSEYLGPYGDPEAFKAYRQSQVGFDFEKNTLAKDICPGIFRIAAKLPGDTSLSTS
jgi:hypothetical protein